MEPCSIVDLILIGKCLDGDGVVMMMCCGGLSAFGSEYEYYLSSEVNISFSSFIK